MKKIVIAVLGITLITNVASAQYVYGHRRTNGTWVQGYHRSSPDGIKWNNYSHSGNTNPFTGKRGYKSN